VGYSRGNRQVAGKSIALRLPAALVPKKNRTLAKATPPLAAGGGGETVAGLFLVRNTGVLLGSLSPLPSPSLHNTEQTLQDLYKYIFWCIILVPRKKVNALDLQ
jgi:hypothetical protein